MSGYRWTLKELENARKALARYEAEGEDRNSVKYRVIAGCIETITEKLRGQGDDPECPTLRYRGVAYFENAGTC